MGIVGAPADDQIWNRHRLVYHSTLGLRVIKMKKKDRHTTHSEHNLHDKRATKMLLRRAQFHAGMV